MTISKDHMLDFQGIDSPGPACYEAVSPRFSTGVKFARSRRPSNLFPNIPERTPGSVYQPDSPLVHRSLVAAHFPKSCRDVVSRSASILGPGEYEWEKSSLSRRASSFGESFAAYSKVYFKGVEREHLGRTCDVLGTYRTSSNRGDRNGISFTRSSQREYSSSYSSALGPGSYTREESRDKPSVKFGPRPEKQKPRLDLKKIRNISKSFWL